MRYSLRLTLAVALAVSRGLIQPAQATTPGVCFSMKDVPAGDALNLRTAPNASAKIVASYPAGSIVILAKTGRCGKWCRISASDDKGTKRGWVNARYLRKQECP